MQHQSARGCICGIDYLHGDLDDHAGGKEALRHQIQVQLLFDAQALLLQIEP